MIRLLLMALTKVQVIAEIILLLFMVILMNIIPNGWLQPEFYLTGEYTLKGLWFCNSSYTYGVIMHGNKFGASGVATPLSAQVDAGGNHIGYFQVELECYDFAGNKLATYTRY